MTEERGGSGSEKIKAQVFEGLGEAKEFAKSLDAEQVKSGEWFVKLLQKVVHAYDRNARAKYFQKKYPGLPSDEIADTLVSVTARYATIAGGVAGATASAAQVSTLTTAGMTAPIFVGAIGSEMIYLSRIQMRLILDLSVVYDLQLDPDDPEDVLMVFGYAMGVAPTELVGAAARHAAGAGTQTVVKKYVSKHVLKAVQDFARKLGFKILQKTILKYAVPVASAAVGGGYNYVSTGSVGNIAKAHFRNRRKFTKELQTLISRKNTYELVFPATAMYVANLDGELSPKESELYRAILSRMSFEDHAPEEFRRLLEDGENLIEVAASIEDPSLRRSLMEVIVLMAVCDGELADEERGFLSEMSDKLDVPLDMDKVERSTEEYRTTVKQNIAGRTAATVGGAAAAAGGKAALFGGRMKGKLGQVLGRNKLTDETSICPSCLEEISGTHKFCPECGQPTAAVDGSVI